MEAASGFEPENNGFADAWQYNDINDISYLPLPEMPISAPLGTPSAPYTHPAFPP
jgi:hypothetical protein